MKLCCSYKEGWFFPLAKFQTLTRTISIFSASILSEASDSITFAKGSLSVKYCFLNKQHMEQVEGLKSRKEQSRKCSVNLNNHFTGLEQPFYFICHSTA